EVTGDGNIVVFDSADGTTPVNLPIKDILLDLPQKVIETGRRRFAHQPISIPADASVSSALSMVFLLPQECSKGFLVRELDRSVTGLVGQQQCCGPMQIPVVDVGVKAFSLFDQSGGAFALGEQPIK